MRQQCAMQRARDATGKTWLAAALAVWLLVAESFAFAHQYDSTAHANGQSCTLCVSAASFAAGAVSAPAHFEPAIAASFVVVAAGTVFLSTVPTRRYARGPPAVSFTF
jgi:cytochrome c1